MRKSSHSNISDSSTRNQEEIPGVKHSDNSPAGGYPVFPWSWFTDVSQINPEWDKSSNFGENEIFIQNLTIQRRNMGDRLNLGTPTKLIRFFVTILTRMPASIFVKNHSGQMGRVECRTSMLFSCSQSFIQQETRTRY